MYQGLIRSVLRTGSAILSVFLSFVSYPAISFLIRKTFIFTMLKNKVIEKLALDQIAADITRQGQRQLISSLPLPDNILDKLVENNNSTVYSIFGANNVADYIGSYIAGILLNIFLSIFLTVVIYAVIKFLFSTLEFISRMPVVHTFNMAGGGLAGLFLGVVIIWLGFMLANIFITDNFYNTMMTDINNSLIAKILYEHNFIQSYFYSKGIL